MTNEYLKIIENNEFAELKFDDIIMKPLNEMAKKQNCTASDIVCGLVIDELMKNGYDFVNHEIDKN